MTRHYKKSVRGRIGWMTHFVPYCPIAKTISQTHYARNRVDVIPEGSPSMRPWRVETYPKRGFSGPFAFVSALRSRSSVNLNVRPRRVRRDSRETCATGMLSTVSLPLTGVGKMTRTLSPHPSRGTFQTFRGSAPQPVL